MLPGDVVEFTTAVVDKARGILPYALGPNLLLTPSLLRGKEEKTVA